MVGVHSGRNVDFGNGKYANPTVIVDSSGTILDEFGGDGALQDSEAFAGIFGWNQGDIYINPTVTAGGYTAGDVVGGEITLTNFMRLSGKSGLAYGVTLVDVSGSAVGLDFLLFNAAPTANLADNAAYAWNSADYAKLVMHFRVDASEWTKPGPSLTPAVCSKALSAFPLTASGSADLYLYIVCVTAPTFAATTDLHVRFGPARN